MPRKTVPAYCLHKASGQAFVRVAGKNCYLGVHGTPESHRRYTEEISRWHALQDAPPRDLTVGKLTLLYLRHAGKYYVKNGEQTGHLHVIRNALKYLNESYRDVRTAEFGPKALTALREKLIRSGYSRKYINDLISVVKRMFRWAASEELAPVTVYQALATVGILAKGRSAAKETPAVRPVPLARVEAIRDFVAAPVWGAIQFQLLTGARPGEALTVRGCDLDMSGPIWTYTPESHKTEHHGRQRIICIGPQAQEIVRQYLDTRLEAYLFGTPKSDGTKPYRRDSYTNAINRGCELAFKMPEQLRKPDKYLDSLDDLSDQQLARQRRELLDQAAAWRAEHCWSPNQLRHTFATRARKEFGIEAARVTLGHSSAAVTELYAERDIEAACVVAAKIG